jgi:hypothetical protein
MPYSRRRFLSLSLAGCATLVCGEARAARIKPPRFTVSSPGARGNHGDPDINAVGAIACTLRVQDTPTSSIDRAIRRLPGGGVEVLGPLGSRVETYTRGINLAGTVAGFAQNLDTGFGSGFLWQPNGTLTMITDFYPLDINDAGVCAGGGAIDFGRPTRAGIRSAGGLVTDLGTPAGLESSARGINFSGMVCGSMYASGQPQSDTAFTWTAGGGLDPLPLAADAIGASAQDINEFGDACGSMRFVDIEHPCVWPQGGAPSVMRVRGGGAARALNSFGAVVGNANDKAMLWSGGKAYPLEKLVHGLPRREKLRDAVAINDRGEILAHSTAAIYLLSPVPPGH